MIKTLLGCFTVDGKELTYDFCGKTGDDLTTHCGV